MRFKHTVVETLAYALPEERLSSQDLERLLTPLYQRLKLPEGRLELMTGIRERRLWPKGTRPSEASALAGRNALAQSNIPREKIDLLMHTAVCRDRLEPATAAYVHRALGLPATAQIMDLSNACLGFLNALVLAAGMIESGLIENALITAGENGRPLIEHTIDKLNTSTLDRKAIKPYFANLTVGCAAVAAVLCRRECCSNEPALTLEGATLRTNSAANTLCEGDTLTGGLAMQTDSEKLLEVGVALAQDTWKDFSAQNHWNTATPHHVICHQVGKQHQRALYERLGLDLAKDVSSFAELGNCGAVSLPITLALGLERRIVNKHKKLALLGIGSGLSCLMMAAHT